MENSCYNGNGIWIPYEILQNDELTSTEKILYAEIYYLDRPDEHCTASNEHLAQFLKISEAGVKKCLTHLRELGYIRTVAFDGRKRSIATNVKWREEVDTTVSSRKIQESPPEVYKNEFLLYRENKIENSRESTLPGALTKHPRNFSKNKLSDELSSGKVIDEQKREKKKETEYEKCLKLLDDRYDDPNLYMILVHHLEWSYNSGDPKRIRTAKAYSKRLDDLDKLQGNKEKIVTQSIDKQWHCFYELQTSDKKSYTAHSESKIQHQTMSAEEAKALLAKEAEEYGVI